MFPRALRHAPMSHFGLDIIHLYTQMGTARVAMLVDHCWRNTPTRKFLRLNIEDIVLESGLYGPLWDQNYKMYSSWCQTDTWIFQVCKFNADHHITSIDVARLMPAYLHVKSETNRSWLLFTLLLGTAASQNYSPQRSYPSKR